MKYEVRKDEKVAKEKLFHPDKVCMKGDDLFISIERETLNVFLVMSAIWHSCEYFGNLGINQEPLLEYKEYVDNYLMKKNALKDLTNSVNGWWNPLYSIHWRLSNISTR